ncbi:GNAT family N-acetyltransferase [Candidatus Enterococcus lemimoniae]|nr:GNAT family N-acetyltransferase [Enterococcus sp. 12C11_DIV0727]
MWVGGMAVVPKYRRDKVASKLMDYAEQLAKENQCEYLILEVN